MNLDEAVRFSSSQSLRVIHLSSIEHIQYHKKTQGSTRSSSKHIPGTYPILHQCLSSSKRNPGRLVAVHADHHYSDSQPFSLMQHDDNKQELLTAEENNQQLAGDRVNNSVTWPYSETSDTSDHITTMLRGKLCPDLGSLLFLSLDI
jgi:hypothetical protein